MRISLRERLSRRPILVAPGVYDALTARMVESCGFEAAFMSGAGVSYARLGRPDIGLLTMTEMVDAAAGIASAVNIPIIADGDNGHGNAINVMRTVRLFEAAGVAALLLEDQTLPKRCGHLAGKRVVSQEEMVGKLRAAQKARASRDFALIARTDARSILGLDATIQRAKAYLDAGADILFIEAPESERELAAIARAFPGVPLLANMVEGGKTPLLSAAELEALGYAVVIYPNALARRFVAAGRELLAGLKTAGSTHAFLDCMVMFSELNALVGLDEIIRLEREYVATGQEVGASRSGG